jgi:hypothetical protein
MRRENDAAHVTAYYYLIILERRHGGAMGERLRRVPGGA